MATSLITHIPEYCISAGIPDPQWSTDAETLTVSVFCADGSIGVIYEEKIYPAKSLARVWEMRELIEKVMRLNGRTFLPFYIRWRDSETTTWTTAGMRVVFCEMQDIDDLNWFQEHFATTAPYKILPQVGQAETLPFFCHGHGEDISAEYLVTVVDDSGAKKQVRLENEKEYSAQGLYHLTIDVAQIAERVEASIGSGYSIVAMMVRVGQRYMNYYATREEPSMVFVFRNCFNAVEYARFDGVTETKLSDGSKIASVARRAVKYDSHRSASYEVETAPLTPDFCKWLAQMVSAPMVWLANGTEVVITDGDATYKDEFNKMYSLKFSWQPADARASFSTAQLTGGIFNEVFNETFM